MLYLKRQFKLHKLLDDVPPGGDTPPPASGGGDTPPPAGGDTPPPKGGDTPPGPDPAKEYSDFVERFSKGDAKIKGHLGRYANLEALAESAIATREKFAKGEIKAVLPKGATEDQVKAWRAENGIPEAPDKYELKLEKELTDTDKAVIGKYLLPKAHGVNMNGEQAAAAVEAFRDFQAARTVEIQQKDSKDAETATNKLTVEWGGAYQGNKAKVEGLLSTLPAAVRDKFMGGRLADGTGIFNDPDLMKGMLAWANEVNPTGTIVPADGGSMASSIEDELNQIKELRKTDNKKYLSEPIQKRERELIAARDKAKGKK